MHDEVTTLEKPKSTIREEWKAYCYGWDDASRGDPFDPPPERWHFYTKGWLARRIEIIMGAEEVK